MTSLPRLVFLCLLLIVGAGATSLPAPVHVGRVDCHAIKRVEQVYPGYGFLVTATRQFENGPRGLECGNYGQTRFAKEYFTVDERNYGEAGRSLARFSLEFGMLHRKEFMAYLGKRYAAKADAKSWTCSVSYLERQARLAQDTQHSGE